MTSDPHVTGVADAPSVPSPHRADYDDVYRLRRQVSTMADVATNWMIEHVREWCAGSTADRPFRILSIGCGDGELDERIVSEGLTVGPIDYVGCDINERSLSIFADRVTSSKIDDHVQLLRSSVDDLPELGRFDLVLLSHVGYYFADPATLVLDSLERRTAVDGRVVVIHSGHEGVPAMTESVLGTAPFEPAESIVAALRERGVSPRRHHLDTEIRLNDELLASEMARELFSFLVERPSLDDREFSQLVESMKNRSTRTGDAWVMGEEVLVLEIVARLSPGVRTRSIPAIDPIRDYHALEEAFDWFGLLSKLGSRTDRAARLLDIGCGTGRWLRVLAAANSELVVSGGGRPVYDRVDPVTAALDANTVVASAMFDMGRTWADLVEFADLPAASYDLIWSVHSLYAQTPEGLPLVIDKAIESLAPGGVLIIALASRGSFYIEAKPALLGTDPFVSSDDVIEILNARGLPYRYQHVDYVESFDGDDDESIRRFVWHESIGNSYLPAGLGGELPTMPTGPWFESFRTANGFEFRQRTGVIVVES